MGRPGNQIWSMFWALGPGPSAPGPCWPLNAVRSLGICALIFFCLCSLSWFFLLSHSFLFLLSLSLFCVHFPVFEALGPEPTALGPELATECHPLIGDLRSHSLSFCDLIQCSFCSLIHCSFCCLIHRSFCCLIHCSFCCLTIRPDREAL